MSHRSDDAVSLVCALVVAFLAALPISSRALADPALIFSSAAEDKTATLSVTTCPGESEGECISHDLQCSAVELSLYVAGDESPKLLLKRTTDVVSRGLGNSRLAAKLSNGRVTVDLPIDHVEIVSNDMNGTWDLKVGSSNDAAFFEALTTSSASGLTIMGLGSSFKFDLGSGDASKIMSFKKECEALRATRNN